MKIPLYLFPVAYWHCTRQTLINHAHEDFGLRDLFGELRMRICVHSMLGDKNKIRFKAIDIDLGT